MYIKSSGYFVDSCMGSFRSQPPEATWHDSVPNNSRTKWSIIAKLDRDGRSL